MERDNFLNRKARFGGEVHMEGEGRGNRKIVYG